MQQTAVARLFNERTGDIVLRGVLNEYLESGFDSAEVFPDSSDAGFTRHAATLAYIGIRNAIGRTGINGIYVSKQGNRIFITRERKD